MRLPPREAKANAKSSAKALDGAVSPLPGWTTQIQIGAVFEGSRSYHAQVFRDMECLCHVVLAGVAVDAERADEVLAMRVRNWIEAFDAQRLCGSLWLRSVKVGYRTLAF